MPGSVSRWVSLLLGYMVTRLISGLWCGLEPMFIGAGLVIESMVVGLGLGSAYMDPNPMSTGTKQALGTFEMGLTSCLSWAGPDPGEIGSPVSQ